MTEMTTQPYAVFLSYNSQDEELVEKVAIYLDEKAKLRPWFDKWSLIPGDPWVRNLEHGLKSSSNCAVFVGADGLGPWEHPEVELALRRQVKNKNFRVIPVLLPNAPTEPDLPAFLEGNSWIDFRKGLDDVNALWRLECGIRGINPGRSPASGRADPKYKAIDFSRIDVKELGISRGPTKAQVKVFISYRHQEPDSLLAPAFAEALNAAGHEVFIDTGIRWGSDWVKRITEALERSEFLLLLLSRESGLSEFLVKEVKIASKLARQRKFPIILPIRLEFPFSEALPYQLDNELHSIQQESWNGPNDTVRLVKQLLTTVADKQYWPEAAALPPTEGSFRPAKTTSPTPFFDPRDLMIPGGAIEASSRFYISRSSDNEVFAAMQRSRALVTVRGPRQAGKTSLLMSTYVSVRCAESQLRTAFIDFQALANKDFKSLDSIWQAITMRIAAQLQLSNNSVNKWKNKAGYDNNTSVFLDEIVFGENNTPLVVCLDEVDTVFNSPIKSEFFGSLRAFFNRGALDPSWKKVRWLLGSSSEPSFFIEDLTQSPFTIGLRVDLNTFTAPEVEVFATRHGLSIDAPTLGEIMDYVGGRPYLVHLILYHFARKPDARKEIFDTEISSKGIFKDHLHTYLVHFRGNKPLAKAMLGVIAGQSGDDPRLLERLEAAGLIRKDDLKVEPMCRLYSEFFKRELK